MENNFSKDEFLKETGLTDRELKELKEEYIKNYAISNGMDYSKLTNEQLNEIKNQDGYKKAGLLLS